MNKLASANNLVSRIGYLDIQIHPNAPDGIHPKHVRQVVELAFIGIAAAWEEFLAMSFLRYLAGARTASGFSPQLSMGRARSLGHAYKLIALDPNFEPQKNYLQFNHPGKVGKLADLFFEAPHCYDLRNDTQLISHANSIRNRVAHSSDKCKSDFKQAALFFLKPIDNKLKNGYGPGDLLRAHVQHKSSFGEKAFHKNLTHFEAFAELYEKLADKIVPSTNPLP